MLDLIQSAVSLVHFGDLLTVYCLMAVSVGAVFAVASRV